MGIDIKSRLREITLKEWAFLILGITIGIFIKIIAAIISISMVILFVIWLARKRKRNV